MPGILLASGSKKMAGGGGGTGLLTDLVSYWALDEASGNAIDSHGSNDLTDINTVGSGTGLVYSGARDMEVDNGEYFEIASNSTLNTDNDDFTFSAWVRWESLAGHRAIIGKWLTGQKDYLLYYDVGSGYVSFVVNNSVEGDLSAQVVIGGGFQINTWYHFLAWYDSAASKIKCSLNNATTGSLYQETTCTNGADNKTSKFQLGSYEEWTGLRHDGLLGPVAFWKRVLTSDERDANYNSGAGLAYSAF